MHAMTRKLASLTVWHEPDADDFGCTHADMVGVYVRVSIELTHHRITHTHVLQSPGLWGIESDSDPSYFAEVAHEQWSWLRSDLCALGFTPAELAALEAASDLTTWERRGS